MLLSPVNWHYILFIGRGYGMEMSYVLSSLSCLHGTIVAILGLVHRDLILYQFTWLFLQAEVMDYIKLITTNIFLFSYWIFL